jgi:uncharacterized membrane protein YbhN (UPF0104 family)
MRRTHSEARSPVWSKTSFKLGLSVLLLVGLLWKTDLSDLAGAVARADPWWVLAALVCYVGSQVVSSVRWTMLARPLGFNEPFSTFFAAYFTGMYFNLFAPSTVAGDISRALHLAGTQRRKSLAFTTVIADRGLGFIVLCWIGALAIILQPGYRLPPPLWYAAWVVPPGTLLAWLYLPQFLVRMFAPESRPRRLVEHDLAAYWRDRRLLLETSAVAAVFHVMQIVSQVWLARALGVHVAWPFFFIFVPVVNILGMLPISFSGIGIREGGYLFFLGQLGVPRPTAVAIGLLSSAVVLASGLAGGAVYLLRRSQPGGDRPLLRSAARDR